MKKILITFYNRIDNMPLWKGTLFGMAIILGNSLVLGIITTYILSNLANEKLNTIPNEIIYVFSYIFLGYALIEAFTLLIIVNTKWFKSMQEDSDNRHLR